MCVSVYIVEKEEGVETSLINFYLLIGRLYLQSFRASAVKFLSIDTLPALHPNIACYPTFALSNVR